MIGVEGFGVLVVVEVEDVVVLVEGCGVVLFED